MDLKSERRYHVGEQAMAELLELLISKGVVALNIIPDRNWNIKDPETRAVKVKNLYQVVNLANRLDLPINIGTEMNSFGQKIIDDFSAPELAPVLKCFSDGAEFIYRHSQMQRGAGLGYQSAWANYHFPSRKQRNQFYQQVGRTIPPGHIGLQKLSGVQPSDPPEQVLNLLKYD